jgi:hypothetical protein
LLNILRAWEDRGMKEKTIKVTILLRCGLGHTWAPGTVPWLPGNPHDSTIIVDAITGPIPIDVELRPEKCSTCGDVPSAFHIDLTPGEL